MLKAIWQSDAAAKLEKWRKFAGIAAAEVKSLHCSLGRRLGADRSCSMRQLAIFRIKR
jgi:hypothetical protein